MTKNLDVSDSNNILKMILTILIVAGIAYLVYYLYNQYKLDSKGNKKYNSIESENMMQSAEESMYKHSMMPREESMGHKMSEEGISSVNYQMSGSPSGQRNPIMNKMEFLPKGNIVGSDAVEHFPSGEGSLKDRNFLQSGYHIGINTVGQTLRNANLQLRSEPPCPQVRVSPWLQATIEPDVSRKPFEIGGCA